MVENERVLSGTPKRKPELVVAVAAPLGTDLDQFCDELTAQFREYAYQVRPIRLSSLIEFHPSATIDESSVERRMESLMDAGTKIRESLKDDDGVALLGIAAIEQSRSERETPDEGIVYLVRSLKHPAEVRRLREVYGSGVVVIAIHSSRETRKNFLEGKRSLSSETADRLMRKDEAESNPSGQRTRDVFDVADAFVSVDQGPALSSQISRILGLLFGNPFLTPTRDEHAMFLAFATGMRSADLSRQVGAIILNRDSELVSCGTNEVPKAGGGLYSCEDQPDRRDFQLGYESNNTQKERLARAIVEALGGVYDEGSRQKLKATGIFDLTEYGRAVHAEMEALIACARVGLSVRGGTLYSTTYPCHNCAKHIIAAGILRVVYVEPYPKSRAELLHGPEIVTGGVKLEPFIGIGPRRYVGFFSLRLAGVRALERKAKDGQPAAFRKEGAELRFPLDPSSYLEREAVACAELDAKTRSQGHAGRAEEK